VPCCNGSCSAAEPLARHTIIVAIQPAQPTFAEVKLRFRAAGHLGAVALAAAAERTGRGRLALGRSRRLRRCRCVRLAAAAPDPGWLPFVDTERPQPRRACRASASSGGSAGSRLYCGYTQASPRRTSSALTLSRSTQTSPTVRPKRSVSYTSTLACLRKLSADSSCCALVP
jgi:hypothetical protein